MAQHPDYSDDAKADLVKAQRLIVWIQRKLNGIEMKGDHRHRIPAQLFDLAIEHHSGIIQLISANLCASAFALIRCEYECFIRGAWLYYCASDAEIERFIEKDQIGAKLYELIDALEQRPEFETKLLSTVKESTLSAMNGYTHGGIHQISRRLQDDHIEPSFDEESVREVIQFSGAMGLIAFHQIAQLANRDRLMREANEVMKNVLDCRALRPSRPKPGSVHPHNSIISR